MADGLARAGFDLDLLEGIAAEQAVARLLCKARIEIKTDKQALRTGNVFVEYEQPSGPSGIDVTTADWWVFNLVEGSNTRALIVVPTERVKQLAFEYFTKQGRRPVRGGDFNRYLGVLIPVQALMRVGV